MGCGVCVCGMDSWGDKGVHIRLLLLLTLSPSFSLLTHHLPPSHTTSTHHHHHSQRQTAPLATMPTEDLRKSLFLSAKVLDLARAMATYEVTERESLGGGGLCCLCVCVCVWCRVCACVFRMSVYMGIYGVGRSGGWTRVIT